MCVVNKQFELLGFVFDSIDLSDNKIYLTFTTVGYMCLCGVCNHVAVLGLSGCGGCGDCNVCGM